MAQNAGRTWQNVWEHLKFILHPRHRMLELHCFQLFSWVQQPKLNWVKFDNKFHKGFQSATYHDCIVDPPRTWSRRLRRILWSRQLDAWEDWGMQDALTFLGFHLSQFRASLMLTGGRCCSAIQSAIKCPFSASPFLSWRLSFFLKAIQAAACAKNLPRLAALRAGLRTRMLRRRVWTGLSLHSDSARRCKEFGHKNRSVWVEFSFSRVRIS